MNDNNKSDHQHDVEQMMAGFGQTVRGTPTTPKREERRRIASLIIEEALEAVEALGFVLIVGVSGFKHKIPVNNQTNKVLAINGDIEEISLQHIAKELADLSVVATCGMSACGISDKPLLSAVDQNNIDKILTGKANQVTGKFEKVIDHPKPDIKAVLDKQGLAYE